MTRPTPIEEIANLSKRLADAQAKHANTEFLRRKLVAAVTKQLQREIREDRRAAAQQSRQIAGGPRG